MQANLDGNAPEGQPHIFDTYALDRLILHIGPHKTGTTSVQYLLSSHRYRLLQLGVHYPIGMVNDDAHHEIPFSLKLWRVELLGRLTDEFSVRAALERWLDEARRFGAKTLLLSAEDFSLLDEQTWKQFFSYLELAEEDARVRIGDITFVYSNRNFKDRAQSLSFEYVKHGSSLPPEDRLAAVNNLLTEQKDVFANLHAVTERSVTIKQFDYDAHNKGHEFLKAWITETIGFEAAAAFEPQDFEITHNESLGADTVSVLEEFNSLNAVATKYPLQPFYLIDDEAEPEERMRAQRRLGLFLEQILALSKSRKEIQELLEQLDACHQALETMQESLSWKLTKPLRRIRRKFRRKLSRARQHAR